MLADCTAHSAAEPRWMLLYDLPLLLSSAAAQPLAALTPYGCGTPLAGAALPVLRQCGLITVYRCTHQCGERSNAAFGRQSAAVLPSLAPHDSKARLQDVTKRRDSWRSHVHRTRLRSACSSSSCKPAMSGVEGPSPRVLLGFQRGYSLLRKRISPLIRAAPKALPSPPCAVQGQKQRRRAASPSHPCENMALCTISF